ncbi:hypothetical protein CROQUDRAFT_693019 [Cronartium quercuum f. sp. fusiforme G11]|uniref:Uncharacterized protein n=1 Tax=Cronartium quercuum f. sp. fusiforme G11 TaxID=708437 RepID=A0A9P6NM69_9BASI|nr:hypothetical protein CROQUDRAFT_693019 [Cronartium quercuum f. sp. fusiforme G11]
MSEYLVCSVRVRSKVCESPYCLDVLCYAWEGPRFVQHFRHRIRVHWYFFFLLQFFSLILVCFVNLLQYARKWVGVSTILQCLQCGSGSTLIR